MVATAHRADERRWRDPPPSRASGWHVPAGVVLAAAPVLSYFWLLARYGVNIPFWDDFDALLGFLSRSPLHAGDFCRQHNEHRILWTRLVAWLCHGATGSLDLRLLMWIGNATLVGIVLVLARIWRSRQLPAIHFLPIVFVLFQPQSWENMTWAMASLQNFSVLLFAALSISCWQSTRVGWQLAAIAWATLAAYTSGNGLVVPLVLLVWQGVRCMDRRFASRSMPAPGSSFSTPAAAPSPPEPAGNATPAASIMTLLVLLAFTIVLFCFYFAGYTKPDHHPGVAEQGFTPARLVQYLATLCGAYVGDLGRHCAFVAGLAPIACFLLLTWRRYDRRNPVVYYMLMFCLGSILLASLSRAGFGASQALSSRYRVLPLLTLALNYLALYELWPQRLSQRRFFMGTMIVLVILQVATVVKAERRLRHQRERLVTELRQWRETGRGLTYPDPAAADACLRSAIERHVYRLPP